jgi:hypothetical protein
MAASTFRKLVAALIAVACAQSSRAADEEAIKQAVQRGVGHLKTIQAQDGSWTHQGHAMGPTALAGLALLECGVNRDDPSIQRALNFVRDAATGANAALGAEQTYDISLAILFLDRYGSKRDIHVIESLTVRLLAGQNAQGGWTYSCPTIKAEETQRLRESILHTADQPRDPKKRPALDELPKEIIAQLQQIEIVQPAGGANLSGDNSNTQFATLGLWVGRRLGLPVEKALARIEARFRASQNLDGGWGYSSFGMTNSKDTMTCAGLLGLAVAFGLAIEKEERQIEKGSKKVNKQPSDLTKDRNVRAGLLALGTVIGLPPEGPKAVGFGGELLNLKPEPRQGILDNAQLNSVNYYLMWSIERVAMAFDLQRIGDKDWYLWGSSLILRQQQPDGGWQGAYAAGGIDTCFALLFLRRSNLAQDLTASLKGRVHDPGEARLRAKDLQPPSKVAETKPALDLGLKLPDTFAAPELDPATPAGQLSQELIKATPENRAAVIARLRDNKGVVYSEALAAAIPHLTGADKTKARDALATRLTRMSPATLRDKFKEENIEIRRAAVLAAAMNEDKSFIPDILNLLNDPSPSVWRAVPAALRALGGREFNLPATATPVEREQARVQWEDWWQKNNKK